MNELQSGKNRRHSAPAVDALLCEIVELVSVHRLLPWIQRIIWVKLRICCAGLSKIDLGHGSCLRIASKEMNN